MRLYSKVDHAHALWSAARGLCGICAQDVDSPAEFFEGPKGSAPTMDHVYPRGPRPADLKRIMALTALDPDKRRKVVAHWRCNHKKGNRAPTGCEVIFLMAVNARLRGRPEEQSAARRTKVRAERRKRAKARVAARIAAMQDALS